MNPRLTTPNSTQDGGNGWEASAPAGNYLDPENGAPLSEARQSAKPPVQGLSWMVIVATSLAIGAAMAWLAGPQRQLGLPLKSDKPLDSTGTEIVRASIAELAAPLLEEDGSIPRWWIEQKEPDLLLLKLESGDRFRTRRALEEFARTFPRAWRDQLRPAALARTPKAIREVAQRQALENQISELQDALAHRQDGKELDAAQTRKAKLAEYRGLHVEFEAVRRQVRDTTNRLAELRDAPEPSFGIVSAEERRKTLAENVVLQQELRELTVRLTELQREALAVWQSSTALLDRLKSASRQMATVSKQASLPNATESLQNLVSEIRSESRRFDEAVEAFATTWIRDFTIVRDYQVDPQNEKLIETYANVRRAFSEFSFRADKSLTEIRAAVDALGNSAADHARFHVLHSDLKRAVQAVLQAFRRWDLDARMMEPSNNFRLDAALRSARGLYRRTTRRIEAIEAHLQEIAVQRARKDAREELQRTTQRLRDLRSQWDELAVRLVACQQELNVASDQAIESATVSARRTTLEDRIARLENALNALDAPPAQGTVASASSLPKTIQPLDIVDTAPPHAMRQRLQVGGIAAGLALVLLGIARLITTRRAPAHHY